MALEITMPHMGEGVIEGTIARWLKQEGDQVAQYEPVLEIETDKVTTEATAESAGTLLKIVVPEGETVPVGTVLAYIGQPGESPGSPTAKGAAQPAAGPAPARTAQANGGSKRTAPAAAGIGRISPIVGRIAQEHGVDLAQVVGTGLNGRITKKDILAFVAQGETVRPMPAAPAAPLPLAEPPSAAPAAPLPAPPPVAVPGQIIPHSRMRRLIAEHMVRSKATSPHVTTVFEVDFSAVAAHRAAHKEQYARHGVKLTFTAYLIAAIVSALRAHPRVNSVWHEEGLELKREINVGMATAIEAGLIVPVLKGADGLNLLGIARAINDLAERARHNQLLPDEVQGGTFTLTNHGTSGSLFATPIINQPQCGILGVGKIEKRVKVINDAIAIRPLAYVSLTFDHRILDGASADAFVSTFKEEIEGWH